MSTPLCLLMPPEEIAFAAIHVVVELLSRERPTLRATTFDVNNDDVVLACRELLEYYKLASTNRGPVPEEEAGKGRRQFLKLHQREVCGFLSTCMRVKK